MEQNRIKKQQSTSMANNQESTEKTQIYRSMPYIPRLTQLVNKQLRTTIPELIIAPKTTKQLNHTFTKAKTYIPKHERRDAIYRLDCKEKLCPEPFYLGETERTPDKRTSEHRTDLKNRHKPGNKSALIKHTLDFPGHEPALESKDIKVLDYEENTFKRKMLESIYINIYDSKANNFKRDANRLTAITATSSTYTKM